MDGYSIRRVLGEERARARAFIRRHHYMGSDGGSGWLFAVIDPHGAIAGACLIGPASSMAAERSIIEAPYRVQQCKRLVAADDCPVPESQLLWFALRSVANMRGETVVALSYADPSARNTETGLPLTGRLYLAANHFYCGETSQPRYAVIDNEGRARSSRQGKVTLHRGNLPEGWSMSRIPPARIWIAIVTPSEIDGKTTTRRWRKNQWRTAWAHLNPKRRVAAKQWIEQRAWERAINEGIMPAGEPQQVSENARLQPAFWRGVDLQRTAAPIWVPYLWQQELLSESDLEGEATAARSYLPRAAAQQAHAAAL